MVDMALLHYLESLLTEDRKQRFLEVLGQRTKFLTIAMEDVYQLHNTSAVLRSCDIFGIQELHVIETKFGNRLDKNIAMGAEKWVDITRYEKTEDCVLHLKEKGYRIVATTSGKEGHSLDTISLQQPTAILFGTERDGLSKDAFRLADDYLKIPMQGFTESLNISVAAGIVLYHLTSRLKRENTDWHLKPEEILDKRLDWTKKSIKSCNQIIERYYSML